MVPAFTTLRSNRRTRLLIEDPLADAVYRPAHQRRANYDIWQDDQVLLEFAVDDLEDFDARLEKFRGKLVVLRASPVTEPKNWYETSVNRMVRIRARAIAILTRRQKPVEEKWKKSQTFYLGNCCKADRSGRSSVRPSVTTATTEAWDESAGEEGEFEDEADYSDEELEEDDSDDDDYHS